MNAVETNSKGYSMGWKIREKGYVRNKSLKWGITPHTLLPTKHDITLINPHYFPEVSNQGSAETCVPDCISTLYYYYTVRQNNFLKFRISRLFLYYKVRKLYYKIDDDDGTTIEHCINELKDNGAPPEFIYPYDLRKLNHPPDDESEKLSKFCRCLGFECIERNKIKLTLANNDPIVCGIRLYKNIDNNPLVDKTGILPEITDTDIFKGGHSVILVGYDDNTERFKFMNSWGTKWGDNGFGYINYKYIYDEKYSDEFFIFKNITNPKITLEHSEGTIKSKLNNLINIFKT